MGLETTNEFNTVHSPRIHIPNLRRYDWALLAPTIVSLLTVPEVRYENGSLGIDYISHVLY